MTTDFSSVVISRLKDKSSPSTPQISDNVRRWLLNRHRNVCIGDHTLVKRGVQLSICAPASLTIGAYCTIHEGVRFLLTMPGPTVTIGNWVNVGFEVFIGAKHEIAIGDYTVIAPRCYFVDVEHGFDPNDVILNQRSTFAPVRIGRDCYFGTGTVVTKGVNIGDGAVIGANSVVTQDIGAYEIWAGTPARFIKKRSVESRS